MTTESRPVTIRLLLSPVSTPPCMAAPTATTSSGLTAFGRSFTKEFLYFLLNSGDTVEPPTRITSSISDAFRFASCSALRQGSIVAWIRLSHNCSNWARVKVRTRCLGIPLTGKNIRQIDFRRGRTGQFNFCLFSSLFQTLMCHRVLTDIDTFVFLEFIS